MMAQAKTNLIFVSRLEVFNETAFTLIDRGSY